MSTVYMLLEYQWFAQRFCFNKVGMALLLIRIFPNKKDVKTDIGNSVAHWTKIWKIFKKETIKWWISKPWNKSM